MVVHNCNPSTPEAEAGGLEVPGQPGLHSKNLSQINKQQTIFAIIKYSDFSLSFFFVIYLFIYFKIGSHKVFAWVGFEPQSCSLPPKWLGL
jgi:hypothetical protein